MNKTNELIGILEEQLRFIKMTVTEREYLENTIKKLKEAINYAQCCEKLPIKEDDTEYWVDLVNWESGGIEEVSNNNLLEFKKDIDVEIQRRLKN